MAKKERIDTDENDDKVSTECEGCGKRFSRLDNLKRHLKNAHGIGKSALSAGRKRAAHAVSKIGRFKNPVTVTAPQKGEVEVEGGETEEDDEGQAPEAGSIAARGPFAAPKSVPVAVPRGLGDPPKGRRYDEDEKEKSSARRKLPTVVPTGSWSKWPTITWHGHTFIVENFESGSPKFKTPLLPTLFGCRPGENPEDQFASPDGRFVVGGKVYRFTPDARRVVPESRASATPEGAQEPEEQEADDWPFFSAIGFNDGRKKRLAGSTPALVEGAEGPAPAKKTRQNFLGLTFEDKEQEAERP